MDFPSAGSLLAEWTIPCCPSKDSSTQRLLSCTSEVAYTQFRLRQFLDLQLPCLALIESFELRFHELHPLLLGDFAVLVGIHEEEQLLDLILCECQFILRLRNCCLLCDRSPQHDPGCDQHCNDHDEGYNVRSPQHDWLP